MDLRQIAGLFNKKPWEHGPISRICSRFMPNSLLEKVASAAETRKNEAKKRSLHGVNEHFELNFDDASASTVVFQRAAKPNRLLAGCFLKQNTVRKILMSGPARQSMTGDFLRIMRNKKNL
jgi:hypothetical protein